MDIFVRSLPPQSSETQLKAFFKPFLAEFGISVFELNKFRNKPLANITVLDPTRGHLFLQKYGPRGPLAARLRMMNYLLKCSLSSELPSDIQLRTLELTLSRQHARQRSRTQHLQHEKSRSGAPTHGATSFGITSLSCGTWAYVNDRLVFEAQHVSSRRGEMIFGKRQAVILLDLDGTSADRIDINYYTVDTVLTGDKVHPTITFTLFCPPKFYRQNKTIPNDIVDMLAAMSVHGQGVFVPNTKKVRLPGINNLHEHSVGMCSVYQTRLAHPGQLARVHQLVSGNRHIASTMMFATPTMMPEMPLQHSMTRLNFELTDQSLSGSLPFGLRFQILRLAQNGKLLPTQARGLLSHINHLHEALGETPTIEAVRRLYLHLIPPGPHTEASEYSQASLIRLLDKFANQYDSFGAEDAYSISNRHDHIVLIHRINVTPCGVYLEGPSAEVTNRVLRDYSDHSDYFLRVCFMDEDGESVRFDPHASQEEIYHGRFKSFMNGSYNIAGRGYSFLGFSHSSLRSQTCWFMAPFFFSGGMTFAPTVIKRLGDFSAIRSPARCAARIGQAFTDTTGTVTVEAGMLVRIPDVTRNDRVFSDGVGTISESLLKRIWRIYGIRRALKPTILQIRFAGAKGVVSLDSRVTEDQLSIRPSMEKFKGSRSNKVEICGAAFRPLPMILNRGYIKILEDHGVPIQVFMDLQEKAIKHLRSMTESTINASTFLAESATSKQAQLPTLLEHLSDIGFDYHNDPFLRDVVEMAAITKFRDMKYRGRIPVENGVTLYGIMDETNVLEEGEIYVVVEKPPQGGKRVLTGGRVIVTRSPALHPGDMRVVTAVDVPADSPLGRLSNCVVFSQKGERDLPSQLSGGDLDGDLYNVIFEPGLMPRRDIAAPADYPRVTPIELDREVTSKDMSDFFVRFMETDQLGQISTIHVQLADQLPHGVFDPACITLAEMASTAVDFSKTGVPVDMKQCPRRDRNRPDFMAPSPRAIIESGGINIQRDDDDDEDEDDIDPVAALDPETRRVRYYESKKALGHLYRAIDEYKFLREMRNSHRSLSNPSDDSLMPKLWNYMKRNNVLLEWEHNKRLARQIKEAYENTLLDILYTSAPSPHHPLTEPELFAGTILGRGGSGASSRRLRELTTTMRARFEEILEFTVSRIVNGDADGEDRNDEALPRAMACVAVGVEESGLYDRRLGGVLKSWRYVAAGVALREMRRWSVGRGAWGVLPGA